jgi:hypothetical protein
MASSGGFFSVRQVTSEYGSMLSSNRGSLLEAMTRTPALVLTLLALVGCSENPRPTGPPAEYAFTLDGETIRPEHRSLAGTPGALQEGDVILVEGDSFVLGPPGPYAFEREDGEVRSAQSGAIESVVVCREEALGSLDLQGLRYLEVPNHGSSRERTDYSALGTATNLRYLSVWASEQVIDLSSLKNSPELRHLSLRGGARVASTEFLSHCPELRSLDIGEARIDDLSVLSGHGRLRRIDADLATVETLPAGRLPALRELRLHGTFVGEETVAAFEERNPDCRVLWSFNRFFEDATRGVDRVRVIELRHAPARTGIEERVAVDLESPDEVLSLLGLLAFRDDRLSGACFCGVHSPVFDLFRNGERVGRLSLSHGRSIAWPEAFPVGYGVLIEESTRRLHEWLAKHGVTGPRDEAREDASTWPGSRRRWRRYRKMLPARVLRSLEDDWDWIKEQVREFERAIPDSEERALLWFRMLGVDESSWDRDHASLTTLCRSFLPTISREVLSRAVRASRGMPGAIRGAAWWLFDGNRTATIDAEALAEVLDPLARIALASPRRLNRRRTMRSLGEVGLPGAHALLREMVAGKIKPRALSDEDAPEDERWDNGRKVEEPESGETDVAFAARILGN